MLGCETSNRTATLLSSVTARHMRKACTGRALISGRDSAAVVFVGAERNAKQLSAMHTGNGVRSAAAANRHNQLRS